MKITTKIMNKKGLRNVAYKLQMRMAEVILPE